MTHFKSLHMNLPLPGWSTTLCCDSCSWVPRLFWVVKLPVVLYKSPPGNAHSLVFQHLLHIWSLSISKDMSFWDPYFHSVDSWGSNLAINKMPNIRWCSRSQCNIDGIVHPKMKLHSTSGHQRFRWVCFFMRTDLEKYSITSLAHQWMLCSEWVPSEWESKQLIKTSQ